LTGSGDDKKNESLVVMGCLKQQEQELDIQTLVSTSIYSPMIAHVIPSHTY